MSNGNPVWAIGDEKRADGRWIAIYCQACNTRLLEAHETTTHNILTAYLALRHYCSGVKVEGQTGMSFPGDSGTEGP